jgi:PAS domain S-box-containing protein
MPDFGAGHRQAAENVLRENFRLDQDGAAAVGSHEFIFPAIVEHMRDGVLAIDGIGNIITINAPARSILKLDGDICIGQNFAEAVITRRDLQEVSDSIIDAIYAPNNVLTRDVTMIDGDAARNLVIRTSMLRDDPHDQALGVVAIISDVSEKVRALRERIEFGHLVVLFISMLGLADLITLLVDEYSGINVYSPAFSWAYLCIIAGPVFATVFRLKLPLRSIGLSFDNWRQAVIEGAVVSVPVLGLFLALSEFRGAHTPAADSANYGSLTSVGIIILLYAPHSFVQEVLTRGILQSSLQRLLNDESGIRSLMIASLIFGLFHSYIGLPAVAVTTLAGLLFGYLYMRHGNVIGATMVHVVGGTAAFAFHFM